MFACSYQSDHGIESNPGLYDEETRISLASNLEKSGDGVASAVNIQDVDGDRMTFALSEEGDRVLLIVNGRTVLDRVTELAADEGSGVVEDQKGSFGIRPDERAEKLAELRALLSRVGVRISRLQPFPLPSLGAYAGPGQPRLPLHPAAALAAPDGDGDVMAQAMVRRAWAELGVAIGPTGRPLRSAGPLWPSPGRGGSGGRAFGAGLGLEREPSGVIGSAGADAGRPEGEETAAEGAGLESAAAAIPAGGPASGRAGPAGGDLPTDAEAAPGAAEAEAPGTGAADAEAAPGGDGGQPAVDVATAAVVQAGEIGPVAVE